MRPVPACSLLLGFVLLACLSLSLDAQGTKALAPGEVVKVKATQMSKEFWDNEKAALAKYKDKVVEVEGKVKSPLQKQFGVWQLRMVGNTKGRAEVAFNFDPASPAFESASKLKLKAGQSATIRGLCDDGNQYGPRIKDCSIVEPK